MRPSKPEARHGDHPRRMPGLQRSKTMPTRVRTPSASVTSASRRAAKKSAAAARRRPSAGKSTLKKSIKRQVLMLAETKPFHANVSQYYSLILSSTQPFATVGFGTTSNKSSWVAGASNLNYGATTAMYDLAMLRPFKTIDTDDWMKQNALDGLTCTPATGKVTMNFARQPFHAVTDQDHITCVPMRIRVIRVSAKGSSATIEECNPTSDLFRNQYNREEGITTASLTQPELATATVNRDKYVVHNDIQFNLARPVAWDNSTARGRGVFFGTTKDPSSKVLTFYPQLAEKKDGSIRYKSPNDTATTNATSGHRREFILVHAWYPGVTDRDQVSADIVNDLRIYVTPESRHKDM